MEANVSLSTAVKCFDRATGRDAPYKPVVIFVRHDPSSVPTERPTPQTTPRHHSSVPNIRATSGRQGRQQGRQQDRGSSRLRQASIDSFASTRSARTALPSIESAEQPLFVSNVIQQSPSPHSTPRASESPLPEADHAMCRQPFVLQGSEDRRLQFEDIPPSTPSPSILEIGKRLRELKATKVR